MELATIVDYLQLKGSNIPCDSDTFETISIDELKVKAVSDDIDAIVLKSLQLNKDDKLPLYIHQYNALRAIAEGKDVLLISPCGSGKTRVMVNGLTASYLGLQMRNGENSLELTAQPLSIICCPLTSIIEGKMQERLGCGMLTMQGKLRMGLDKKTESECSLPSSIDYLYGHAESFATSLGKEILESNEHRIFLFVADEVGFNIWGPEFRVLTSKVPGSIRVFSPLAPMLCISATIGKEEQLKTLNDFGMFNRDHLVIDYNPIKDFQLLMKYRRPSNQTAFNENGGLGDLLQELYLNEFIEAPEDCSRAIFFCKNEEDIVHIYQYIESKIGDRYQNYKTRPWIQYHSSLGEQTLTWVQKRMEVTKGEDLKLIISTYKLVMGVNLQNFDLAIFLRYLLIFLVNPSKSITIGKNSISRQ